MKILTICKSCFIFHLHIFHKNYWKVWQSDIWANKMWVYCIQTPTFWYIFSQSSVPTVSLAIFLRTHCVNQMSLICDFPHRQIVLQFFKILD